MKRNGFDLILLVVLVIGLLEATTHLDSEGWLGVVVVVSLVAALFARRRFPFAAPILVWVIGAAVSFVDGRMIPSSFAANICGLLAAYLLGGIADPTRARVGLGVVLASVVLVVVNDPAEASLDFVTIPSTFLAAWMVGYALRLRGERLEAAEQRAEMAELQRDSAARVAVAEERAHITRELHDVVAHAVSVMVLQVGAVRHRLPSEMGDERAALASVEDAGRRALGEMRRLLDTPFGDEGVDAARSPQPGLDRIDALVEDVRKTGLDVRLRREGRFDYVPRAVDLSAYRIVQEALTNCLKHARASRVDVTILSTTDGLEIEVIDDGLGPTSSDGLGRGMIGIRERVRMHGGEMAADAPPGHGFRLAVSLPLRGYAR